MKIGCSQETNAIELDDGKIFTGKPKISLMVKTIWLPVFRFSLKPIPIHWMVIHRSLAREFSQSANEPYCGWGLNLPYHQLAGPLTGTHWLELPTYQICKAYFSGLDFREYSIPTIHMAWNMVRVRTSINWILKISHWSFRISMIPAKHTKKLWKNTMFNGHIINCKQEYLPGMMDVPVGTMGWFSVYHQESVLGWQKASDMTWVCPKRLSWMELIPSWWQSVAIPRVEIMIDQKI